MMRSKITRDNLDSIISDLAKEFRKTAGRKASAELIIVGGGSILINYGFRTITQDIDAIIKTDGMIKYAANIVGDKYNLPNGWLNDDFRKTGSFSQRLAEKSKPYRELNNGHFRVRTVSGEYAIAMKLSAFRPYRNDESDIIGILMEEKRRGNAIEEETVKKAVEYLYGNDSAAEKNIPFICPYFSMSVNDLENTYNKKKTEENTVSNKIMDIDKNYKGAVTEASISDIINQIKKKEFFAEDR